jgi:hypothetical protein
MAYDPHLAERLRSLLKARSGVTEKAMFGGLAYLLHGKMFCGILGSELLARVGPDAHDAAMARPHVRIMDFTGRPMRGYVFVGPEAIATVVQLQRWVNECQGHVETLPDKATKRPKGSGGKTTRVAAGARPRPASRSRRRRG